MKRFLIAGLAMLALASTAHAQATGNSFPTPNGQPTPGMAILVPAGPITNGQPVMAPPSAINGLPVICTNCSPSAPTGASSNPVNGTITTGTGSTFQPLLAQLSSRKACSFTNTSGLGASTISLAGAGGSSGHSYVPGDTVTLPGALMPGGSGTQFTITATQVVSASVNAGGSGGSDGTRTVTGTTGTGTKFQASVTVSGGAITAVLSITVAGPYSVNPTSLAAEPVTGASLSGATLTLIMGVATTGSIGNIGNYQYASSNPIAQASSSGAGLGATFNGVFIPTLLMVSAQGSPTLAGAQPWWPNTTFRCSANNNIVDTSALSVNGPAGATYAGTWQ